jgi:hypothetical protein
VTVTDRAPRSSLRASLLRARKRTIEDTQIWSLG